MSFNTDKNKISKIINKQIDQSHLVEQRQTIYKKIKDEYKKTEPNQAAFKGFITLFEVDWQLMLITENFDPPLGDPWMGAQYFNWVKEFPRLDIRLIPFLTVEALLRVAGGHIDDGVTIRALDIVHYFRIEDAEGSNENIKKVTCYACLNLDDENVTMPYEVKLLIGYNNPQINI